MNHLAKHDLLAVLTGRCGVTSLTSHRLFYALELSVD